MDASGKPVIDAGNPHQKRGKAKHTKHTTAISAGSPSKSRKAIESSSGRVSSTKAAEPSIEVLTNWFLYLGSKMWLLR